ncbi:protein of unknown function [Xenorhabdus poinarii G6]|uniref:Uncharacterized protein n=1 Tax=Xenorhabdus poinarii G6 TaxID=1354304 RepID=A0A068R5B3_9GAMM|nr:protein of unknown function [Xenorhabdus poinarii G6]
MVVMVEKEGMVVMVEKVVLMVGTEGMARISREPVYHFMVLHQPVPIIVSTNKAKAAASSVVPYPAMVDCNFISLNVLS